MERLAERLGNGEVILLDGANGSELQAMGVPMDYASWCAKALSSHPDTVRQLHEDYIRVGADVITTNTFASGRHKLAAAGLGDQTRELNALAVTLAKEARDNVARDRSVYVAGSMSTAATTKSTIESHGTSRDEWKAIYQEQAEILAEAGADLLVLEMMTEIEQASLCLQAALSTGLPVWIGFSIRGTESGDLLMYEDSQTIPFSDGLETLTSMGGSAVTVMHSEIEDTGPGLEVVQESWSGPIGAYSNLGRYERPYWTFDNAVSPEGYLKDCERWVGTGVQIIGGCCGIGREHIALLGERLTRLIPA